MWKFVGIGDDPSHSDTVLEVRDAASGTKILALRHFRFDRYPWNDKLAEALASRYDPSDHAEGVTSIDVDDGHLRMVLASLGIGPSHPIWPPI